MVLAKILLVSKSLITTVHELSRVSRGVHRDCWDEKTRPLES